MIWKGGRGERRAIAAVRRAAQRDSGHDTIRRVFEAIDPERLEAVLLEWIGHVCPTLGKVIAIDGKAIRGSGLLVRGQLAESVEEFIRIGEQHAWKNLKPSQFETLDKGHGRIETRRCLALPVPDYIPEIKRWPGIKCIARIEAVRESHGKVTSEVGYLIGSMAPDAQVILNATRLHRGVENGPHRCLDVACREDASAVHLRQAAANLGVMRKLALNIFRLDASTKLSLPRKRKNAAWKPDYLFDLLGLQPVSQI